MKVKNLYSLLVLGASVAIPQVANAQETVYESEAVSVTEFACDNTNHTFANWRNNWFIQVGAGVDQPLVERGLGGQHAPYHNVNRHNMTVAYNLGFGRWMSPYLGFRLNGIGGSLHSNVPTDADPHNGWTTAKHINVNFELMWDMCNSIGGVNPNRPVSVIPFVGFGGDYMYDQQNGEGKIPSATNIYMNGAPRNSSWTLPVTAGIQFRFRLGRYVDFFAEARAAFYGDNWNNVANGRPIEANVAAIGGFNFNIGGRGWGNFNQCEYVRQIANLNNEVNDLRAQMLNAAQTIAALEAQLPCPEPTVQKDCVNAPLMTTVRFLINSAEIMPTEEVNVYNMAEWLKANPKEKVVIVGYADKDTGTAEYNLGLSQRRAEAVANALVNKYGINASRLTVKYDGSAVQPYSENDWNRIVIFTQK
ncbi:MAG: OmpA family protein [Muribaculaceae bacterium]|nr:OmpA family protein [Muribaculaceae bacterium]